jgi:LPXTG-motif cell wall-anchored protein
MGYRNFSRPRTLVGAAIIFTLLASFSGAAHAQPPAAPPPSANVSVFASGLNNPRGLKFGPDGALYVAEGGVGGANSTAGICDQVVPPIGPYTGSKTARISKIGPDGVRTTIVEALPSSQTSAGSGGLVSGVADVAFIGNTLYGLLAGAGCSHGIADEPNGIIKVNPDGTSTLVADLSAFVRSHPVAQPNPGDFEPDETSYSMVEVGGKLYVVEPNHGALDEITPGGKIRRVLDISASQGHIVPTAVAFHDGNFYVGNLSTFPVQPGASNIYKITPSGQIDIFARGVTAVTGVAFDAQGRLYALETDTTAGLPGPTAAGSGQVVRMTASGSFEPVAMGLTFPTGMTFGPDGKLYVSNFGFGLPPGMGQVVRIDVNAPLIAPPAASQPAKPATLPNTGGADLPWVALAVAALLLLCAGWWLRRTRADLV